MHVYVITNSVNGMRYVGKANDPAKRWSAHQTVARHRAKTPLQLAMRELGAEAFTFEVVESCASEKAALRAEMRWIRKLATDDPERGYNLTSGGQGLTGCGEESRRKMAAAKQGKVQTQEHVAKRVEAIKSNGKRAQTLARVLELYAQGLTQYQIAERVGRTQPRVNQLLKEAGVERPGVGHISAEVRAKQGKSRSDRHWSKAENADLLRSILELNSQGKSMRAIGRTVGMSHGRVGALLRRLVIPKPIAQ